MMRASVIALVIVCVAAVCQSAAVSKHYRDVKTADEPNQFARLNPAAAHAGIVPQRRRSVRRNFVRIITLAATQTGRQMDGLTDGPTVTITLYAIGERRNCNGLVSVRLFRPRIFSMSHQEAARDAASVHTSY